MIPHPVSPNSSPRRTLQNPSAPAIAIMPVDTRAYMLKIRPLKAGIAQLVEHNLAKVGVASSSLVSRSRFFLKFNQLQIHSYKAV